MASAVGTDAAVWGWALIAVVLAVGGIQLLFLSLLGEYLWRTGDDARGRPVYVVSQRNDVGPPRIRPHTLTAVETEIEHMTEVIALGQPTVGDEELEAIAEVFSSGWLAGNGPMSRRLEVAFAEITASAHALAVGNCTEALHLALIGLGVERGRRGHRCRLHVPATGHAVMYDGAEPVFADVRSDTWTVDPAAVEAAITERTVGIIAVDVFGQCADYDELRAIADRHGLWLVEDAAAATGAGYRGRPAGSLADVACFSFHGRKGVTSGEGGALTTSRPDIDAKARKLPAFGIESALTRASRSSCRSPSSTSSATTTSSPTSWPRSCLRPDAAAPRAARAAPRAADAYATLLGVLDGVTLPGPT